MVAYVRRGLLNSHSSLNNTEPECTFPLMHSGPHTVYFLCICRQTGTDRGYWVRSPTGITSLELLERSRRNGKQTDVWRVELQKEESKCHENFHVVRFIFQVSDRPHHHFSRTVVYDNTIWLDWQALNYRICWTRATYHMDLRMPESL